MSRSLVRMCKLAELYFEQKDEKAFRQVCTHFEAYMRKHAHYEAKNDGTTPNPWRKNMDYAGYENSPYFGSVADFLKKFPGGIREWVVWRRKTRKDRNSMYDNIIPAQEVKAAIQEIKKVADEIDFEDQTQPEEEYQPTAVEEEESQQVPTAEETKKSKSLVEKILDELVGDGLVSEKDIEEWKKSQPLKTKQREKAADDKDELREELAELEHDQWMEWAKSILKSEDISKEREERWEKECFHPYNKLSEEMKDFDREWADKVLKIVKKYDKVEKKAHYEPVGGDDVDKFKNEESLYANIDKFKSIKEFLKQYHKEGQSADDAALRAAKDMVAYWKLLLKGKGRRKGKK